MTHWDGKERRERNESPVEQVVSIAVIQTLTSLGFDMSNPIAVQEDVRHLRKSRELCDAIKARMVQIGTASVLGGGCYAVWEGIKTVINK